VSEND
jgi:hypothetical protein